MNIAPHDRFSRSVTLDEEDISRFAQAAGDANPLHHDREFARRSGYGSIIASGHQTSALLMGLTATYLSKQARMVGLQFSFRFRAPVPANEPLELEWLVTDVRESARLGGRLVNLAGRLRCSGGRTEVGARGRVLVRAAT
jgi:acyl dehydratase